MTWLVLAIIAYALLAVVSIGDRYLLSGPLPHPATYAFYVGLLGVLIIVLTPFFGWPVLHGQWLYLALISGVISIFAMLIMFWGLHRYEVSNLIPAIGGLTPIFTAAFSYYFFGERGAGFSANDLLAFVLLILGSVVLTSDRFHKIFSRGLEVATASSILFALSFVLAKVVYEASSFWPGFLWMRIGGGIAAVLIAVFSVELRHRIISGAIFHPHPTKRDKRTAMLFLGNQALGASALILQNIAIYLVVPLYVAFINALEGLRYVFLFTIAYLLSSRFPDALPHEYLRRKTAVSRAWGIGLICAGLVVYALTHG